MAIPRPAPYVWVTWLAKVMADDNACQWQFWFQAHNQLERKHASDFDTAAWTAEHNAMLNELKRDLVRQGLSPFKPRLRLEFPELGATLEGKPDWVVKEREALSVFDCKTGQPHTYDQIQVMIYMYCLAQQAAFMDKPIRGVVVYKDQRVETIGYRESFPSTLRYFMGLLSGETALDKSPGVACRFCNLTREDCADREGRPQSADGAEPMEMPF